MRLVESQNFYLFKWKDKTSVEKIGVKTENKLDKPIYPNI